jgi:glycine dehydrogenase subunit 1
LQIVDFRSQIEKFCVSLSAICCSGLTLASQSEIPNPKSEIVDMNTYILNTDDDVKAMLASIGEPSMEALFSGIPAELRLKRPLNVPPAMTEIELERHIHGLARKNESPASTVCFLGGGAYDHFIPAVVDVIAARSEFYTAYTPYQAEASQGTLQAVFEYQTLMCQLTGMDVANASLYEAGSGVAEAVLMAMGITGRTGEVLIAETVHPEYRQTLTTYLANLKATVKVLPCPDGFLDPKLVASSVNDNTIAVVAQSPNFFGHLEAMQEIGAAGKSTGAIFISVFDPVSLGLLTKPGEYGADIAVGEGQGIGNPLHYGGPYLGILTCRTEYARKIPGRLVGETTDRNGKRCWVLTLQTREQHIRREKATSNICTNQGLFALRAAVHLTALGPAGLKETAELCLQKSHYATSELTKIPGVKLKFSTPFFKEFTLTLPKDVNTVLNALHKQGYHAGLATSRWYSAHADGLMIAVTEKRTKAEIDGLVSALRAAIG